MASHSASRNLSATVGRPEDRRARQLERQRARLLGSIVEIVAEGGYARTSIGELARSAGVSRGTFYELFADKEACFLAAFDREAALLKRKVMSGQTDVSESSLLSAVESLVAFAAEQPRTFDFLFHEALLAGRQASDRRDELVRSMHELIKEAGLTARADAPGLDIPPALVLDAVLRLLTMNIKRGSLDAARLSEELAIWIDCYRVPRGPLRWGLLAPLEELKRPFASGNDAASLRRAVPKGRHGLSPGALRALQRQRIAYGTADAILQKGYADVTVSDIVASAGVSRDVFYAEFHDKHEAFNEAAKLVFEQLLATLASAYYGSTAPWPERVWSTGTAFARFLEDSPVLAHFLFVGTSAPQPQVDRVNEYILAFKVFIDDGYAHAGDAGSVPVVCSEVLVCGVLAVVTYQIRHGRTWDLRGLIPVIVYMVLAPFLGQRDAEAFVDGKIRAELTAP